MTAPPSVGHQRISGEIFRQLANYLEGKCEVFAAPFGVRLFEQDGDSPEEKTVQALLLEDGKLLPYEDYGRDDVAKGNALDGCFIELGKVFTE